MTCSSRWWTAAALAAVVLVGCGPGLPQTVKLGGKVTLDGKPLSEGTIMFYPADKDGAAPVAAPVVDGLYSAPAVPKGSYRVAFSSKGGPTAAPTGPVSSDFNAPSAKDAGKKDPIPEKYHKPSLPAEAAADNPNLNFDLVSK